MQPRFADVGDSAVFFLNRARVGIEGSAAAWATYKVQVEVRNLGMNGTLATVTGTDLFVALPDRSLIVLTQAPKRDVGFMAEWRRPGVVLVQGGVFNGEGPNHASNPDSTWWDAQTAYRRGPLSGRAEYLRRERARPADHSDGWYAQAAYLLPTNRVQLVARVEQYDPSAAAGGQETGYTAGAQYLLRGDDLKLQASYTAYSGAGSEVTNNPLIVQLQVRW